MLAPTDRLGAHSSLALSRLPQLAHFNDWTFNTWLVGTLTSFQYYRRF